MQIALFWSFKVTLGTEEEQLEVQLQYLMHSKTGELYLTFKVFEGLLRSWVLSVLKH